MFLYVPPRTCVFYMLSEQSCILTLNCFPYGILIIFTFSLRLQQLYAEDGFDIRVVPLIQLILHRMVRI
jgi:hypothetical protein